MNKEWDEIDIWAERCGDAERKANRYRIGRTVKTKQTSNDNSNRIWRPVRPKAIKPVKRGIPVFKI